MKKKNLIKLQDITFGTIAVSSLFLLIGTSGANAATSAVDEVTITVPASCSLTNTIGSPHTATIETGVYQDDIGETTFKVFCNDNEGFAVYAVGYTNDEYGNTTMKPSTLAVSNAIATGTATSGNTSNWAMKLTAVSGDYAPTLETGFNDYHIIPDTYTKVASYASNTDGSTGSSFKSTYGAFVSQTQPADSYTGKIKYTVVHPANADTPVPNLATLDSGRVVNAKLKSLAATVHSGYEEEITPNFNDPDDEYAYHDEYIKSISIHLGTPAPTGFTPSEANTISSSASNKPIYMVFDDTNDAGIMHFYTEGEKIFLPADSSFMFYNFSMFSDLSNLSNLDSSNVINMSHMFFGVGRRANTFSLNLSTWVTSNVTNMQNMFRDAAYYATTWSGGDLSSWDTSNVTNMSGMFYGAGSNTTTFTLNLSSWNTSNVEDMSYMFTYAGYDVTTFSLDLSSWNTSNVTNMNSMFDNAGRSATTWSITIPHTNGNSINNTTSYIYGKTTSVYGTTSDNKSFTLAQS